MHETIKLNLEFIILATASIVYLITLVVLFIRPKKAGDIKAYIAFTLGCLYWTIGELIVIVFYQYFKPYFNFVISIKLFAGFLIGPLFFIFSLYYIRSKLAPKVLGLKKLLVIFSPNILMSLLTYTDSYHGLFTFGYNINGLVHYTWVFWFNMIIQSCYFTLGFIYEVAKNGLSELRHTVSDFISTKIDSNNILDSIKSLVDGFIATGIKVDFTVHGYPSDDLSDKTGTVIYNICREALTNALKHGKASSVNIILRFNLNLIDFFIFDNGIGCKKIKKGIGLMGMENRISSLNGIISFGSGSEKGFSIHAEIPI